MQEALIMTKSVILKNAADVTRIAVVRVRRMSLGGRGVTRIGTGTAVDQTVIVTADVIVTLIATADVIVTLIATGTVDAMSVHRNQAVMSSSAS